MKHLKILGNQCHISKSLLKHTGNLLLIIPDMKLMIVNGTLAKQASEKGFITYMMTPDKDFAQLVSENIYMYKPSRSGNESVQWGPDDIRREFSVKQPLQVIDILALLGDSSDNIPGAPGIGPKTAMKLISEYGSVEELLNNTGKLTGKLRENIENNREKIELSKKLATIIINVPVEFRENELLRRS
jgi:DNA polymerase-1